jgi:hypothetical protein
LHDDQRPKAAGGVSSGTLARLYAIAFSLGRSAILSDDKSVGLESARSRTRRE